MKANNNSNSINQFKDMVNNIFKTHNLSYEYSVINNKILYVCVDDGDWKHDHIALKLILMNYGFVVVKTIPYPSDYDIYTAEYTFAYMN